MRRYLPLVPGSALVAIGIALTAGMSPPPLLLALTAGIFLASQLVSWDEEDRVLYRTLGGIPLVIALAAVFFWAGVIAQCGIVLLLLGREEIAGGWNTIVFPIGCTLAILATGFVIDISNHMIIPTLVLLGAAAGVFGAHQILLYRTKRTLAGVAQ